MGRRAPLVLPLLLALCCGEADESGSREWVSPNPAPPRGIASAADRPDPLLAATSQQREVLSPFPSLTNSTSAID